ncbi:hypothetical protein UFOVP327_28 [uncultured Caudovirales phage]|jgi:hypothetical protein|uniref:Uncharacterized protein n=1 Tax=uncultured Caudovirales phage TaxID=2100421 RepID=A0A6J5LUM6_9CAUD|nr:hypothetical protein UFOVP327_28 [uncultured Caudovirales phage]
MKLSQLASKPQLIQVTLDDAQTIEAHGEAVEFWTWDRQPLDTFMKLAQANQSDTASMIGIVRTLILDDTGKEIISDDSMLPTSLLLTAIQKIVEQLGKS